MANDSTVAQTIREQIGMWPLAEVGARSFLFDATSLYFDAKPWSRIVRVKISLEPEDLYTVIVLNKKSGAELYRAEGVFNDQLAEIVRELPRHLSNAA